jgi:hypothetical protein
MGWFLLRIAPTNLAITMITGMLDYRLKGGQGIERAEL